MQSDAVLDFLLARRSAGLLTAPGPTRAELDQILAAAGTVPDHGLLRPYRFVVAETEQGLAQFGDALAKTAAEYGAPEAKLEKVRQKAFRSPTLVAVISSPKPGKIEPWEQAVTASCAGYAIVLAATALGVGAVWKSVPFTKGKALTEAFGLSDGEEMLGFIHLGRAAREDAAGTRAPVKLAEIASVLDGGTRTPYPG